MELDEIKQAWQAMGKRLDNQETLTNRLIEKITDERYHSKLNKIGYPEYIGSLICYLGAIYLIFNFSKLEDVRMQLFAGIAVALLITLPIISLKSLQTVKGVPISSKTYLAAIDDFGKRKIRFQKLQKLNVSLGLFLMLVAIPVLSEIQGKDIAQTPYFWTVIFPASIAFFLAFSFWVLRFYDRILNETEKMLSDIHS